ncbi:MAG: MFS transporter [Acetobacteraceae bacterium]|nr:MFS transporter [Acetobacteraceae bacterium]
MSPAARQLAFVNLAHSFTHYCLLILPTAVLAMVLMPDGPFGDNYELILPWATGGFVLYGLLSLPQGWLAGRFGRHRLMTAFFLGAGLSMIATGLASSPVMLGLALAATGAFAAIYHPIGTALLVDVAGEKPGRAIGLNGVFGNIGVAMAPMVTAFVAFRYGWQWAFILPGVACTIAGVFWLREPVYDVARSHRGKPFPEIPPHLVRRAVTVLLLVAAVSGLVFNSFTLLLPKLMQERLASAPGLLPLAGVAATVATLCGAVTQLTVGRLIDRTTLRQMFLPMAVVLVPALAVLSFVEGWAAVPVAGVVAAVLFGQVTVNETMTARYISPALRTRMYSIRFFVGFLGSAASAPMIAALYGRTGSQGACLAVLAGFALITLVCAWFFPNRREELNPELWAALKQVPEPARAAVVSAAE